MPSPFPGMDPYLEAQGLWPSVHIKLINYFQEALSDRLPGEYEALIGERLHLVEMYAERPRNVLPDVVVLRDENDAFSGSVPGAASVATLEPVTCTLPTEMVEEREAWIEIRRLSDRRVVTMIEVLSPTNKLGDGFALYKDKRVELLGRPINVVEIDLLFGGNRLPVREKLPAGHYYAYLARAQRRPRCEVYAWGLRQPLPTLPIPLHEPDPDIPLDLAAVFATVYERGRYRRAVDYTAALPSDWPLAPGDRAWAEGLGLRGSQAGAGPR